MANAVSRSASHETRPQTGRNAPPAPVSRQVPAPRTQPPARPPGQRSSVQLSPEARGPRRGTPNLGALTSGLAANFGPARASNAPAASGTPAAGAAPRTDEQRLMALRQRTGRGELRPQNREAIQNMTPAQRRLFSASLGHLERLADSTDTGRARTYMNSVMRSAAQIAGRDGQAFVDLVQFAFSDPRNAPGRGLLGGGYRPAGAVLEQLSADLLRNHPGGSQVGFAESITERTSSGGTASDTITHHFGEFLAVGAQSNRHTGVAASWLWEPVQTLAGRDGVHLNPPDTRNGIFASMLGDNLANGRITPNQAVALTEYAFRPGTAWVPNNDVQAWLQAMNARR